VVLSYISSAIFSSIFSMPWLQSGTVLGQEAYAKHQERIIMETSRVYWRENNKPLELEDVKSVTMESFVLTFEVPPPPPRPIQSLPYPFLTWGSFA